MENENISNFQRKIPIPVPKVRTALRSACRKLKFNFADLSVVFVGEKRMRRLNREYLGHDYVTDVLSFPNASVGNPEHTCLDPRQKHSGVTAGGEIIICPAVAARNAKRYGNTFERELILYVVHGILHLCGYDDRSPEDVKRMRRKEQEIMELWGHKT
ncbi:MAG: rRNA maturation RNase YbeY [Candidatus Omnitrophota bacterium]|nr:rRNA maturation RNase YbeY [Candidatus Omnitrophota bacterium]